MIQSIGKNLDVETKEKSQTGLILFCMNSKKVAIFVFGSI